MSDAELAAEVGDSVKRLLRERWQLDGRAAGGIDPADAIALWDEAASLGWGSVLSAREPHEALAEAAIVVVMFEALGHHPAPLPLAEITIWSTVIASAPGSEALAQLLEQNPAMRIGAAVLGVGEGDIPDVEVRQGRLHGIARLVPYATIAEWFLVRVTEKGEPAFAMVNRVQAGAVIESVGSYDRLDLSGDVRFDGAEATVLCRGTDALAAERVARALASLAVAAELATLASTAITMAVEYSKVRSQYGRTIGSFQAIKHLLADAWVMIYATDSDVEVATDAIATADDAETAEITAGLCLAMAITTSRTALETSLQVHGGIGFTEEYRLSWYFNRVLSLGAYATRLAPSPLQIGRRMMAAISANS